MRSYSSQYLRGQAKIWLVEPKNHMIWVYSNVAFDDKSKQPWYTYNDCKIISTHV